MSVSSYPNIIPFTVCQTGICVNVEGEPGTGKTKIIRAFAKACNWHLHTLYGSLLQPTDHAIPFADDDKRHLKMLTAQWVGVFQALEEGLLFMDELRDCSPPQMLPLQKAIQERLVGDDELPPGLRMITACNAVEVSTNGNDFSPALANRMGHFPWEIDWDNWERGMCNGGNFPPPRFVVLPEDWETLVPKHLSLCAAFRRHMPNSIQKMPEDRSKRCGPWPSLRSWHHAAIAMASLESVGADVSLLYRAVKGFVGEDVGLEYQEWHSKLDLPDPEAWLALALDARSRGETLVLDLPDRGDKIMAVLAGVVDRVKHHSIDSKTGLVSEERWLAGIDCCVASADSWREAAMLAGTDLLEVVLAKNGDKAGRDRFMHLVSKVPQSFANECCELLGNIRKAK